MKKSISRELIVGAALELMCDPSKSGGLNFREVARAMNCAHTNLYNYFPTYNDLLWAAHTAVQSKFIAELTESIKSKSDMDLKDVFGVLVNFYFDHTGWFRLAWQERIDGERPQTDIEETEAARRTLRDCIFRIMTDSDGITPDKVKTDAVLHHTHCYLIGEISNCLSGRGFYPEGMDVRKMITEAAVRMFRLSLSKE